MRSMFAAIPVLLALTAVSAALTAVSASATVFEVSMENFQFVPPSVTIAVGDSVHWMNMDQVQHTVTAGPACTATGEFDSGSIAPGSGYGLKFTSEMLIPYHCSFHCPTMAGTIQVRNSTPARQQSWGAIKRHYR